MIFDIVIYVTLINLTEIECILILLQLKNYLLLCLCVLEALTLDKSKRYFVEMNSLKIALLQVNFFICTLFNKN